MTETLEVDPRAPRAPLPTPPRIVGAVAGLLAGLCSVCMGILVTALGNTASPIDTVGSSFIDRVPRWLKNLAIDLFGTNDKTALRVGIWIVLALVATALGATRRWSAYAWGTILFTMFGLASAAERTGTTGWSYVGPIVGAVAGIASFVVLMQSGTREWFARRRPTESAAPLGFDRRQFVGAAGAVGAVALASGLVGRWRQNDRVRRIESQRPSTLPDVDDTVSVPNTDGFHPTEPFFTPNDDFYRIDTAMSFPTVDRDSWSFTIDGLVENPLTLTYADLLALPQVERPVTLCCVSNPVGGPFIGTAMWQGVLLKDLLDRVGVLDGAEQVFSTSLDGWTCGFPVDVALDGRDCMVAIGMNGEPLPLEHGFPARLVVPGLYGYVSATKWLARIELATWDREGYWVPLGWSHLGPVKTQSRIDVPRHREKVAPGRISIAGVAWAQHTGIEKVEVRVDDGPWQEAELGNDVSDDTWRQWVVEWDATPGRHVVQVRATDKDGETQTDVVQDVAPDGATGWHTRTFEVTN